MVKKRRKIWVHKAKSFKEAEEFDAKYYSSMSPEERLSDVQFCREQYYKFTPHPNPLPYGERNKGEGKNVVRPLPAPRLRQAGFQGRFSDESGKGLRRVFKVIKRK